MQPFAESGGSRKTGGSQAWKRLWLYNYHLAWKTDPEQMQNRTRGRQQREKRTTESPQGPVMTRINGIQTIDKPLMLQQQARKDHKIKQIIDA